MPNEYINDLIVAVHQMRQKNQDQINLDAQQTFEFFKCRRQWGNAVKVCCEPGHMVELDLPSFPLPVMTHTLEHYEIEGVRIVPKYEYHGIVNFFLSRSGMNLIPATKKTNAVVETEED